MGFVRGGSGIGGIVIGEGQVWLVFCILLVVKAWWFSYLVRRKAFCLSFFCAWWWWWIFCMARRQRTFIPCRSYTWFHHTIPNEESCCLIFRSSPSNSKQDDVCVRCLDWIHSLKYGLLLGAVIFCLENVFRCFIHGWMKILESKAISRIVHGLPWRFSWLPLVN